MAWHDVDVKAGVLEDALISWYFTLSHELAHNIVLPHNGASRSPSLLSLAADGP